MFLSLSPFFKINKKYLWVRINIYNNICNTFSAAPSDISLAMFPIPCHRYYISVENGFI